MRYKDIKEKNKHIDIYYVDEFDNYGFGKIIAPSFDFSGIELYTEDKATFGDSDGVIYERSISKLGSIAVVSDIRESVFGGLPVQAGWCIGHNDRLNALEYHKGSEVIVAITDLLLLLGFHKDIVDNSYPSSKVKGFYIPKDTAVELYPTTLHFAPVETHKSGFKAVIILPDGTNKPLEHIPNRMCDEDALLFAQNKWLIAHKDSSVATDKGAFVGIEGDNITIAI